MDLMHPTYFNVPLALAIASACMLAMFQANRHSEGLHAEDMQRKYFEDKVELMNF